jgi:hypothetical protein
LSAVSAAIDSIAAALPVAFRASIAFLLPAFALLRAAIAPAGSAALATPAVVAAAAVPLVLPTVAFFFFETKRRCVKYL